MCRAPSSASAASGPVTTSTAASGCSAATRWVRISDILFNPEKTTSLGKPVGADSSLKTWTGDQWKLGGGSIWGWYAWDPKLNLVYYGTGNPSTWNPAQRAGPDGKQIDQKWSMSIIARNPQTGEAAWAYQMTPFDEWDFDGVNEMILVDDMDVKGNKHNVLVHFDRNGLGYTVDRKSGLPLVAEKYDPAVNWTTGVDLDPKSAKYGRPAVVASKSTFLNGQDVNTVDVCPAALGTKDQQPAAYSPLTKLFYVPTNHVCMDYEPFKVEYTAGQPYVGATLSMYPPKGESHMGNFIAWDASQRQDRLVEQGAVLGLVGCSHHRWRHRLRWHPRGLLQVRRSEGRQGAV